jgi:uncharacterized protein (DUF2252 family)
MPEPTYRHVNHTGEARDWGRSLRSGLKRSAHSEFEAPDRDPVAIIEEQNSYRIESLVPVRIGRMLESPFAFYRGTAAIMARDLSAELRTGVNVVSCGDAHAANFGFFAAPDRRKIFDLNDFDEAAVGPWEWDVKRLAGSVAVGFRHRGFTDPEATDAARAVVWSYRNTMRELFAMSAAERYYFRVEFDELVAASTGDRTKALKKLGRKAEKKTSERVLEKFTTADVTGEPRIVDQPPILQHLSGVREAQVETALSRYMKTLRPDIATLLSQYRLVDFAVRVVGVGSVGTRCFIALLLDPSGSPLFVQIKEAQPSVLETYGGITPVPIRGLGDRDRKQQGYRVVSGQQVLQAASDPFLGWVRTPNGIDYYLRQFRDMKGSVDLDNVPRLGFHNYGVLCGRLLARAHSQSPGAAAIAGYLGTSETFDNSVARWSLAYADQAEKDYEALRKAVKKGRLPAEYGV